MAQTIKPRTKVVYDTQQERRNSTPAGVAAYDAARGAQITPQRLAPQRPPFSEMPMGQANYQPRMAAPAQAQQPQAPQFGGQPAPQAGTPQAANWMQAPIRSVQSPVVRDPNAMAFLPRAPMQSSQALRSQLGYQTDQYGRQYQMTPQMAGTAMPQGGAGGWMQGRSLGGAPHGIYVQGNNPSPTAGMETNEKLRFLADRGYNVGRINPGGAIGSMSPAGRFTLHGGDAVDAVNKSLIENPDSPVPYGQIASEASARNSSNIAGSKRYQDLKTRRQQMADQRIVARARMRGMGQNTPAVRAAMQRQGMLAQGQGVAGGPGGVVPAGPSGEQPAGADARLFASLSKNPGLQMMLQQEGVAPEEALNKATPERFETAMLQQNMNPADYKLLQDAIRVRMARDEPFKQSLSDWQRENFPKFLADPKKFHESHRDRLLNQQRDMQKFEAEWKNRPLGEYPQF